MSCAEVQSRGRGCRCSHGPARRRVLADAFVEVPGEEAFGEEEVEGAPSQSEREEKNAKL